MIEIILVLLFIGALNPSNGMLACGLVAFAPKKKREANLDWIKLMLCYNSSRGTDSCGIYINEEIKKGIGQEADVKDWLVKNKLEYVDRNPNKLILAHMRRSSFVHGPKSAEEAHPFTFTHEGKTIIGAHNGKQRAA